MSANVSTLVGWFEDPRHIQLVQKLTEKTRQGKVPWLRSLNGITADLPDGLSVNFVLQASIFPAQSTWELFVIRDSKGNEILRVHSVGVFQVLVGNSKATRLQEAVAELFSSILTLVGDEVEKAIRIIDKI